MQLEVSPSIAQGRLNRKLSKLGKRLCKSRPGGELNNLGLYHIIDTWTNAVKDHHIDYEGLRELCIEHGALSSDMTIAIDDK